MDALQNYYKNSLLNNLCKEYKGEWQSCHNDKSKLMELVLRRQSLPHFMTYAHNGCGITKEYAKTHFKDYLNGNKVFIDVDGVKGDYTSGMYIDYDSDEVVEINLNTCAILWCKDMNISVPTTMCPFFYISNDSDVNISLDGFNYVSIYLFDNSKVTIDDADEDSKVVIYKYSDKAQVELGKYCLADVRVFNKELRL